MAAAVATAVDAGSCGRVDARDCFETTGRIPIAFPHGLPVQRICSSQTLALPSPNPHYALPSLSLSLRPRT